ncbi:NAD(P)H-binding protein, partial [Candidatus Bathyarchaeota archaeon]|nr:NAD(P)H-binding protein [Candidatus Bathyarchaeota archaeon]
MSSVNTLVFGATGAVGSAAAHAAKDHGANVILAVRDLAKPMPNTTLEEEQDLGFSRVQADLLNPDSLRAAVKATKATRAFVYVAFGSPDYMKSSFEALKSAGIEFVVLLSSAGIFGDPRDVKPESPVFFGPAQAEIGLEETFGKGGYVAVRPASFASNSLWWREGIQAGEVRLPYPQATNDCISPADIGRVSGAVLAKGPSVIGGLDGKYNDIRLYGPKLVSQGDAAVIIGKAVGKEVKVTTVSEEKYVESLARLMPEALAWNVVTGFRVRAGLEADDGAYAEPGFSEASGNVEKYGGKPSTQFGEWVE